ncbi:DHH family phosphoesterase [Methanosarcinaceae archaeon]|nr:DHH family phosphoesterase [Methanosarcinaceae archaeon]MBQ3620971.1 DHH family phosphoesterase [Methanosarcinaceae archaeon]
MRVDDIEFVNRLLDYRKILYLCHRNADPDAVGSAFALAEVFGGDIGLSDGCNRVAQNMVDRIGISVIEMPDPSAYDLTVIVDTSTRAQLNDLPIGKYAVIDHHSTTALLDDAEFYIHEDSTSTVEIVYRILEGIGIPITEKIGTALITGIITDTGHLKHAGFATFDVLSRIIRSSGVEYFDALELMATTPQDISIRIAMLKAAERSEVERIGNCLIATTHVSSYGGAAASMLTNIGADIAFVGTLKEDGSARVSGRAKRDLVMSGVNLGKIMEVVGSRYSGTGGGHGGAAGIDASCTVEQLMSDCVEKVKETVSEINSRKESKGSKGTQETEETNDPDDPGMTTETKRSPENRRSHFVFIILPHPSGICTARSYRSFPPRRP